MKKLPIGIQNFKKIVTNDYVYVDKTRYVHELINDSSYYFLSRPRRFGKSLLLDTIAEAFSGDKELFRGLWIYDSDYDFVKHPVIRLDMSGISSRTPEIMESSLLSNLKKRVADETLNINIEISSDIFQYLIEDLYKKYGQRVVVLIDEYDKPIIDHLDDIRLAEENRKVLRGFYGILKSMDPYLRMTFITGVSKFTKTSIFSGLNNIRDITMSSKYSSICGIDTDDLEKYFSEHIEHLSKLDEFSSSTNLCDEILAWYDGYSWNGKTRVINPYSLLNFFTEERFSNYWYASGTPKFLLDLIKTREEGYANLQNLDVGEWALDSFDIDNIEAEPLLFQTGYLTVKEVLPGARPPVYIMGIPNYEVRVAFNLHILAEFTEKSGSFTESAHRRIKAALEAGDLQSMLVIMRSLFASIPYELHIKQEQYYHSIFYAILNLLGFDIDAEVSVSGGRVDAVLELGDKVYVIEFKYEHCEKDAAPEERQLLSEKALTAGMKQIRDRDYADKYAGSGKTVYQAAFAFLGRDDVEMCMEILQH